MSAPKESDQPVLGKYLWLSTMPNTYMSEGQYNSEPPPAYSEQPSDRSQNNSQNKSQNNVHKGACVDCPKPVRVAGACTVGVICCPVLIGGVCYDDICKED